ncbi:hypothetical protein ABW20_dc0104455 [Dactylellina cionopaga]|nr:hypothetical protein ABW20_dc0104455 [Dactylellina cionopaga]
MSSAAPATRPKSSVFTDATQDEEEDDAFSKLASRHQKPVSSTSSRLPPVEPKSLAQPPTYVHRPPESIPTPHVTNKEALGAEEDEDDYMSMTVADPHASETPLQRLKRRKLEASLRGHPLSKSELAEQERLKREIGLSTSILTNEKSKGLKMMKAMGYSTGSGLGKSAPGAATAGAGRGAAGADNSNSTTKPTNKPIVEPIKPVMRESRMGIGHDSELKRKYSELNTGEEGDSAATKRKELSPESYRNRLTLEAQQRRHEAQLVAAQSICEKLVAEEPPTDYDGPLKAGKDAASGAEDGKNEDGKEQASSSKDFFSSSPTFTQVKQINLIYRGLLYRRALSDLKTRLRKREQESISSSKYMPTLSLPKYNSTGEFTEDDKIALSLNVSNNNNGEEDDLLDAEEKEWEDAELKEFEKREVKDRLDEIVRYLRGQWRYCFWCKFRYGSDEEMEKDCPGLKEEDHD